MTSHATGSRDEWLAARLELLQTEKTLTRMSDEAARQRQALPWVRIDKDYRFDTRDGPASLAELFAGRTQLIVYHFMFGPDYRAGCPSCSAIADGFDGIAVHLQNHDVAFAAVSRAPLAHLVAYATRMGWTFPWVSSNGSDFNYDFGVAFTEAQQYEIGIAYNYRQEPAKVRLAANASADPAPAAPSGPEIAAAMTGTDVATYARERPGVSAFALQDGAVHHTYSTFSRGLDDLWGMYKWLDRAPKGRNEPGMWLRRRDEYGVA
ncbi:DUF899 domain-containing protein [Aurantimonas sp. A2-1-M11]|uniref:DUF899 domain-containing protein n=1 Tax=Aurantimonas sp. A2-1-M11 TaxID=3113712 RepID=UPI002F94D45C